LSSLGTPLPGWEEKLCSQKDKKERLISYEVVTSQFNEHPSGLAME